MDSNLAGKRIVVTGGAGFLGGFVCERLKGREADLFVPLIEDYDLVKLEDIRRMLDDAQPEMVVHLAARVGGIGANQKNPGSFFYDNLMMGVQLMHESYLAGVDKFVAIGSICAYPKFAPIPFKEEDLWDGYPEETNAPYGMAKKMLLVMSQAYRQQYNFNSIVLFPVNLYGPGDNFDLETSHVIPAMIRKCIEAKEAGAESITLWGDGKPTREFLYVDDCAEGICMAAEHYNESDPVNLGVGFEFAIRDLATLVKNMVGFEGKIVWDTSKPNGQPRRSLDNLKARKSFGFATPTRLEDGLQKTIDWYLENREQADKQPAENGDE
jgi:GDP-L-fucose synthase